MCPLTGTAKLADFGLATRLSGAPLRSALDFAATSSSLAFPVHSLGLGSRGFTPPEKLRPLLCTPAGVGDKGVEAAVAEDEAVGAHDIFSLGVLSHLVLCGSRARNGVGPALGGGSSAPPTRLLARSAAQAAPKPQEAPPQPVALPRRLDAGRHQDGGTAT